jgi:hypothetical protein
MVLTRTLSKCRQGPKLITPTKVGGVVVLRWILCNMATLYLWIQDVMSVNIFRTNSLKPTKKYAGNEKMRATLPQGGFYNLIFAHARWAFSQLPRLAVKSVKSFHSIRRRILQMIVGIPRSHHPKIQEVECYDVWQYSL